MATKKLKTISIRGKEYVTVNERIRAFNEEYPNGKIATRLLSALADKHVFVEATITPDITSPERTFNAHSQGVDGEGTVNKTACLENVETSAIGRALGLMGIGILDSVASADEMVKAGVKADRTYTVQTDAKCVKCDAPMAISKTTGKPYCKSLCWKKPQPAQDESFPAIEDSAF